MAGPERPGALVDAAAAPARRGGRLTEAAKRAGLFALAYLAFEITIVVAGIFLFGAIRHVHFTGQVILVAVFVFGGSSAPYAWLPLSLVLYPALKTRIPPIVACLMAGAITGAVLAVLVAIRITSLLAKLGPPDTSPPDLFDDLSFWLKFMRQLPEIVMVGGPCGALGGLVFWVFYFWLPTLTGAGKAPLREA